MGYQRLLSHALMPRVVHRLEERLRAANKDNLEQAYESLKNYLMLYTPDKFDPDAFKAYVGVDWDAALERSMAPEQRQALDQELDAALADGVPRPAAPMDKNLVAAVRDMLVAYPLEYRVFSRLKRARVGADIQPFTVAGAAGPSALTVFERTSGEPLTKGISGLYTREGYRKAFEPAVDKAARQLASEESWVLGVRPTEATKSLPIGKANPELTNRVRQALLRGIHQGLGPVHRRRAHRQTARASTRACKSPASSRVWARPSRHSCVACRQKRRWCRRRRRRQANGSCRNPGGQCRPESGPGQAGTLCRAGQDQGAWRQRRATATGPPLEQMVDDHFANIHRLMAGQPPPMDEIIKLFNDVYVQLAAVDAAQKSKSAPPPSGGGERIAAAAGQLPEPARSMLEKLSGRRRHQRPCRGAPGPHQRPQADQRFLQPGHHWALSVHRQLDSQRASGRLRAAVRRRRHAGRLLQPQARQPRRHRHQSVELQARGRRLEADQRGGAGRLPAGGAHQGGLLSQRRQDAVVQGRHPGDSRWTTG